MCYPVYEDMTKFHRSTILGLSNHGSSLTKAPLIRHSTNKDKGSVDSL